MSFDIISIGEPLYELNQQPDGRFLPGFGGDTSNVAIAAARLGARAAYVTLVGDDMFGAAFLELWRREEVDASHVRIHATQPTGVYFVTHGPAGHAFTYLRAGSAASRIAPDDLPAAAIAGARFLHVSAISQAISASAAETVLRAMSIARQAGTKLSYDTNLRLRLWPLERARVAIESASASADILKTSRDDAEVLTGSGDPGDIAGHFLGLGARAVVVTAGEQGALVATAERRESVPAFAVESVDATGAGDAFTGALLAELAAGGDLWAAARFASAAAALATCGYGAVQPLPRRAEVEALLRSPSPRNGGEG